MMDSVWKDCLLVGIVVVFINCIYKNVWVFLFVKLDVESVIDNYMDYI